MAVANAALPAFVGIMVFMIGLIIRKQVRPTLPRRSAMQLS
jgi:hypothetical protein